MHLPATYVLYHAHCADGFGAAYAAWTSLQGYAHYIAVTYGQPLPEIPDHSIVYILDFSYDRQTLLDLHARSHNLVVIDHHKTAAEALAGLDFATFDLTKSGAVLTWDHFHPGQPVPQLLLYVQDRDLWRWELPGSRAVSAALATHEHHFGTWDALATYPPRFQSLAAEGAGALRLITQIAKSQASKATLLTLYPGCPLVPVVNATAFKDETCEQMQALHPQAPFVACYYIDSNGDHVHSLRSGPDFDVSAIAKLRGGGGHPQAAGFTVKFIPDQTPTQTSDRSVGSDRSVRSLPSAEEAK